MKPFKLVLGLLVILLLVAGCTQQQRTINTNGQATVKVQPDEAAVYISIETLKDTAESSKNKNSEITDRIYSELYKLGIERDNIQTESYNIYEEFDWTQEGRNSLGFKTAHMLKITTEQFDDVGEIIDAVINVGEGFTRINYINFELSDAKEKEYKKQVLAEASKDARAKAEAIAEGLGAQLGDIVSISDSGYNYQPYPLYDMAMGAKALEETVSTQISPRELEVSASVQVVYEVK